LEQLQVVFFFVPVAINKPSAKCINKLVTAVNNNCDIQLIRIIMDPSL